jgi:uncharacterized membrane protein YadS
MSAGAITAGLVETGSARSRFLWPVISVVVVVGLAALVKYLDGNVPLWFPTVNWVKSVEYPVYAIGVGLLGGAMIGALGIRSRLSFGIRTEFFIKTGLVLLGASINLNVLLKAAGPAIAQSLVLVTTVFLATWYLAGLLGLDMRLRAILAAAVSICGVSAAIAAAGAVRAGKEQLAYVVSLVILFALPSIFIEPWLASQLGLSQAVAGAWIGGNIDTTAAVTAAGSIVGDDALKVAAIVKQTQNAVIGVVAFLLTAYFVFHVERAPGASVSLISLWQRFPKFILGFIAASAIGTWYSSAATNSAAAAQALKIAGTDMRVWFFIFAFVCIGLDLRLGSLREAGIRPVVVFAAATVLNLALALALASVLFAGFRVT